MWKATEEIGVGRAFGSKWGMNCTFIVARYRPKGNIDSETAFKDNVEQGTFDPAVYNCSNVNCPNKVTDYSQNNQVPGSNQQHYGLSDKFSASPLHRYRNLYYKNAKDLGGGLRHQVLNGYPKMTGIKSNSLLSRYQVYKMKNEDESLPQFFSNDLSENDLKAMEKFYRGKIPHNPISMQEHDKVVWFLL